jgi:hypothetical protein
VRQFDVGMPVKNYVDVDSRIPVSQPSPYSGGTTPGQAAWWHIGVMGMTKWQPQMS